MAASFRHPGAAERTLPSKSDKNTKPTLIREKETRIGLNEFVFLNIRPAVVL